MAETSPFLSPFVVGIAGGSASGKSTFTNALMECFAVEQPSSRVKFISTDAYFLPNGVMPHFRSPTTGQDFPDYNHPDSLDCPRLLSDLQALRQSSSAPNVILLEGLMVLHIPAVRELLDLRLFIELEPEARALRRIVRNLKFKGDPLASHDPQSIANYYLESARVGHYRYIEPSRVHADLILRGDGDFNRLAGMVTALIRAQAVNQRENLSSAL